VPRRIDDLDGKVRAYEQELTEPAATLYSVQKVYGDKVREQSKQAYGRMLEAHLLTAGVLGRGLIRVHGKFAAFTNVGEERDSLFASFVIGMSACECAIEEGRYLQALALLRQEMETLAQLKSVRSGVRKEKRAPNVGLLGRSIRRLYGDLSNAAHVSKHHIVRTVTTWDLSDKKLPGPTSGTRYFPAFDEGLARRSFALHLMLIIKVISELSVELNERYSGDGFDARDTEAIDLALELMQIEGMVDLG
jgi:hypothetical protein